MGKDLCTTIGKESSYTNPREGAIVNMVNRIDSMLKFPNLQKGETGIQIGFDMSSKYLVSDVIRMHYRTKQSGLVIAIDPDPYNHLMLKSIIEQKKLSIISVQKATYSKKVGDKLIMGVRASYNRISSVKSSNSPNYTEQSMEIEMDTLDNIVNDLNLDYSKIRHINITNNGAEFETLIGMEDVLTKCKDLNLTITSGREGEIGEINGKRDYEVITDFLAQKGFTYKFFRINDSFWWGVINQLVFKRRWIFNKTRFGVIVASKGCEKIKFYQSFS